jgi:zinc protease
MNRWMKTLACLLSWLTLSLLPPTAEARQSASTPLPAGVEKLTTVEGISEYRLANGLRCILFPDAAKPTTTVNVTYLVGSHQENYGETGMAHLLEHLIFKGSKNFVDPARQFKARGFEINGSTWLDRTNYYLTFPASEDNLKWALAWSADAMVNSFIARKDLDSEMSVVRNEFEMGENNPSSVMLKRMQSLLFDWHNYGNSTIGARSDIENVKIENLQAFYRKYYQPDNAVLTVAGKFDEHQALRDCRQLWQAAETDTRTAKAMDGRTDGRWRAPIHDSPQGRGTARDPRLSHAVQPASDSEAIGMASEVLGDTPNGRLYRALVQTGLATQVFAYGIDAREPGFVVFGAMVNKGEALDRVRDKMIEVIEGGFAKEAAPPPNSIVRSNSHAPPTNGLWPIPEAFAVMLSEYIALGDWRLFFYGRDQLDQIRTTQLDAAAAKYFVRDNRVLGTFIPDDSPQRAEVPQAPSAAELLANFKPQKNGDAGEKLSIPRYENLDRRTRLQTFGDLKLALLPKRTVGKP